MAETGRIDALVNNAGYTLTGAAEETSMEEARAQFETNFFGATAMTRAVLPIMRRQGAGRIINVTSLAGLLGVPFMAFYSASKFALEGWSEGLRQEVRRFGIHVSVIEPGDFKTGNTEATVRASTPLDIYDKARNRATEIMAKNEQSGPDPSVMADCVARVLQARRPRLRYRVGMDARWVPRLRLLIPEAFFEAALRKSYEIDS
jgi:NAD(P)-dependent dehydrogenase (short-subunit alcohol dehydrogenase family)